MSRLVGVLALLAGVNAATQVYVLAPQGVPDDETRLTLRLREALRPDVPSTLHTFTLCFWFKVITFYHTNTVLSYAVVDSPHTLVLAVTPLHLRVKYEENVLRKQHQFRPLHWYATCVVVQPTAILLWMAGEWRLLETAVSPLALDGLLVLGQEQDELDGGYTRSQAFSGHVTLLSLWDTAFSMQDLDDWSKCRPLTATPLTDWDHLKLIIHNGSAGVHTHTNGPCNDDPLNPDKVLLVNYKMKWKVALRQMTNLGMWTLSRSFSYQEQHEALLRRSSQYCRTSVTKRPLAWIGLLYNCSTGAIENLNGIRTNVTPNWPPGYTTIFQKYPCTSPHPVVVSVDGYLFWVPKHFKLCSFAEKSDANSFFNMRINCENDEKFAYFYLNFILAPTKLTQYTNGTIYLHGVQPYVVEETYNNGTWCLKKRMLPSSTDIACTTTFHVPLGLNTWNPVGGSEVDPCDDMNQLGLRSSFSSTLLLSTCTHKEFTCNNFQCITLDKICDMKSDCTNGEDESDCAIIRSTHSHLLDTPPSSPLPILLNVRLRKISNIDLMNFAMTITLHVRMSWRDPRVKYHHLMPGTRTFNSTHTIWTPKLWVQDSLVVNEATLEHLMVERLGPPRIVAGSYMTYRGSENPLWKFQEIQVTFFCLYDLRRYPVDRQTCNLVIYVSNMGQTGLEIAATSKVDTCRQFSEEYNVEECRLLWRNSTNNFTIQVTLLRRQEYYIFSTYLPSVLLLAIGYGTLHLPVDFFNERGTMSLTTLLVFISLYTQTSSSLPKTSYMKHIDLWYVFSLSYLSFIITIHLVTCSTALSTKMNKSAASPPMPRGLGMAVVPDRSCGGLHKAKTSLTRDVNILKISRVAFAITAVSFILYYFTTV